MHLDNKLFHRATPVIAYFGFVSTFTDVARQRMVFLTSAVGLMRSCCVTLWLSSRRTAPFTCSLSH